MAFLSKLLNQLEFKLLLIFLGPQMVYIYIHHLSGLAQMLKIIIDLINLIDFQFPCPLHF
jgi:hypothetical protein